MKIVKKIVSFLLFLLVVVLIGIIAIPFLYKDKIVEQVKTEANKTLNATLNFQDVDISLLRNFPDLTVQLQEVSVDGINEFKDVRLFEGESIEVEMNVLDAIAAADNFPLKSFLLKQPKIHFLVLKNGKANWDIVKPSDTNSEEATNYLVKLKQYVIENGSLIFEDRSLDMQFIAKDVNHTGSGQFASDNFDLDTRTIIADLSTTYEGIAYLNHAKAELDAVIGMDIPNMKFFLKDNELLLNDLKINTAGTFDMNDNDYVMDLTFGSPQGDFKSLWSLIPGVYTADYAKAKILGKMAFNGLLKGTYNATIPTYPAFKIAIDVDNGSVQYPDLPVGITGITTDVSINSPSSDFDKMVINIPQFKMQLGDNPVTGAFNLSTPVSDPNVKGNLKGTIDLAELGRAVPIEGITELRGTIQSDVVFDASQSQLDNQQYEQVNISGQMSMDEVFVQQTGTPPIALNHMSADFSPKQIQVQSFNAKMGESDIQASGKVDNILAYFSPEKTMEGTLKFRSNYFNANEWMSEADTTTTTAAPSTTIEEPFDRFNFKVDGFINKLVYSEYKMTDFSTKASVSPNESIIENFSTNIGESDIKATGKVKNLMDYLLEDEVLTGEIALKSKYLNLNQFMVEEAATDTTESMEVVPVPANVDLILHADINKVHYTNFDMNNIKGFVEIKEEAAAMKDLKGNILGGDIVFGGAYDTKDMSAPKFNVEYDVAKIDFNEAFNTFNTFQLIAPLGRYIDGKFTSKLKMSGTLGKDLIPDLGSLNLSGFLHTFGATIRDSKIFEKLSNKLQVQALKNVKLQDSKNWIDIKDGYVELEEATHKVGKDISLKVKGRHHLLQEDLFYLVEAVIPKSQINKTAVGQVANEGWGMLVKEAAKRGVDIDNGEFVKLNINMTGSMMNPVFKIIPVGSDGTVTFEDQANEIIKATTNKIKDSVSTVVNDKVEAVTDKVEEQVDSVKTVLNEVKDSLKVVVDEKKNEVLEVGKDKATQMIDSVLIKNVPLLDSLLLKDSSKAVDKVKDILKDFNPFKKKKKSDG